MYGSILRENLFNNRIAKIRAWELIPSFSISTCLRLGYTRISMEIRIPSCVSFGGRWFFMISFAIRLRTLPLVADLRLLCSQTNRHSKIDLGWSPGSYHSHGSDQGQWWWLTLWPSQIRTKASSANSKKLKPTVGSALTKSRRVTRRFRESSSPFGNNHLNGISLKPKVAFLAPFVGF